MCIPTTCQSKVLPFPFKAFRWQPVLYDPSTQVAATAFPAGLPEANTCTRVNPFDFLGCLSFVSDGNRLFLALEVGTLPS